MTLITLLSLAGAVGAWAAQPAQDAPSRGLNELGPRPNCANHVGFCGKFFWSGPSYFLTLESQRQPDQVVLHYPIGMAIADNAHLDQVNPQGPKTITLTGNVRLATGEVILHGRKLVFDGSTGLLNLDGKIMPSGIPKFAPCTKDCNSNLTAMPFVKPLEK